ncbi:sorting nexin-4-like isoform X2 [Ostrea edulis]|uniref:sorting nexin-4-like isoform X2 n=1 Tax=Ostrea edulis TaxID=37623 RepID=UPI0024AE9CA6|nr:sorting nexin-4-like isoform X2 [Ostrea edulis]
MRKGACPILNSFIERLILYASLPVIMADDDTVPKYSPDGLSHDSAEEDPFENARKAGKKNLLQWMEISVAEPEKRVVTSMKVQDTFIVYLVETRITDKNIKYNGDGTSSLWRRYSEFELLQNYLSITYPYTVVPPLPEKKASYIWQNSPTDKFDLEFIERRRAALEIFMLRVAAHPILSQDRIFVGFMRQEDGWKDSVYATDFQSKAESRLKALNASFRLQNPDRQYEELKNYCTELESNIANLLKIRAKMADKLYGIHKIHANYSRVFGEWSGIEKEMNEPLQSAAHYMNVYCQSVDSILEEEEQYADQLKEYLAFAESLRSVCRKYECLQYDMERAEDNLTYKKNQKEMLEQGKTGGTFSLSGMKTKIFGSDTPEQRDQKIKQLEEQIEQTQVELRTVTEELQKFVDASMRDIDRFKRQKVKDLKEIFTNYAVMQIKQCKRGIAVWTSAKDCYTKM